MAKLPCVKESDYAQMTLGSAVHPSPSAMSKEGSVVSQLRFPLHSVKRLCANPHTLLLFPISNPNRML